MLRGQRAKVEKLKNKARRAPGRWMPLLGRVEWGTLLLIFLPNIDSLLMRKPRPRLTSAARKLKRRVRAESIRTRFPVGRCARLYAPLWRDCVGRRRYAPTGAIRF